MNSRFCVWFFLAILVTGFGVFPVLSEDDAEKTDLMVFDLGKIEVVGKAEKAETNAVSVVDAETFDKQLDESVVEAVERQPGVTVTVGDKNEPQIMIRGVAQGRILILYDGVPMAAPYYKDVDTSELPLDNVSELKIVRGNASVLYGPNALGGVVSLVSGKPGTDPNFRFLGTVDKEGNFMARATHGMRKDAFYYQLSLGVRESDGWPMSDDFKTAYDKDGNVLEDGDIRDNSQYSQYSGGLKLGGDWGTSEVSVSFNYADAEKGIPPTTSPDAKARFWTFPEWKKYSTILAGRTEIGDDMELRGNVFYHKYDNVLESYRDPRHNEISWTSTYDDYSAGALGRFGWDISETFVMRASLSGILDNHRSQGDIGDPWEEYEAMTYSVSSEIEWLPVERFTMQFGAGYDIYDFDSVNNIEGSQSAIDERAKDINALTFSALGSYTVADVHEITGAVSMNNRFPTMHELFSNIELFEPEDVTTIDPEKAMEYSLGYTFHQPDFSLGAAAFYYDVDDLIERPNRDALYMNIDKAEFKGIELWADYGKDTGINGKLAYTYLNAEGDSADIPTRDLPYVPENQLHADLGYAFAFGTGITVGYTWRDAVIEYDDTDVIDVPSYSLWDLTIRHDFDFGLALTLQGTNLTDENYYQETGFEQPGRNIRLGVHYTL